MHLNLAVAARAVPLTALMLGAWVSQSAELRQARSQEAAQQAESAKIQQEQK